MKGGESTENIFSFKTEIPLRNCNYLIICTQVQIYRGKVEADAPPIVGLLLQMVCFMLDWLARSALNLPK